MAVSLHQPRGLESQAIKLTKINPQMAAEMLRTNATNRPLRKRKLRQYEQAMRAGQWKETYDPIRFGQSGKLIDGQHRLQSLINADVTLEFLIIRGVDDAAFDVLDAGAPRSLTDLLVVEGYQVWTASCAASAVQVAYALGNNMLPQAGLITNQQGREYLIEHPLLMVSVDFVSAFSRNSAVPMSHASGAALHFHFSVTDTDLATPFIGRLFTGEDLASGDVILSLRNHLLSQTIKRGNNRSRRRDAIAATIRVWNSLREDKPLKYIHNAFRAGPFPQIR